MTTNVRPAGDRGETRRVQLRQLLERARIVGEHPGDEVGVLLRGLRQERRGGVHHAPSEGMGSAARTSVRCRASISAAGTGPSRRATTRPSAKKSSAGILPTEHDLAVARWADAEAAIALLKRSGVGRATFQPLDTLRP